ncbi:MAG: PE-PPE domain-containing protein, partial [Mycobacterium sp.]
MGGNRIYPWFAPGVLLSAVIVAAAGITPSTPPARAMAASISVQLAATDALVMTGTDMHVIDPGWIHVAVDHFVAPTLGGEFTAIPVVTPEEFWPFGGLFDRTFNQSVAAGTVILDAAIADTVARHTAQGDPDAPIAVFGYSQSAVIITFEKRHLLEAIAAGEPTPPLSFVMLGNPGRPNGGIHERFPGFWLPGWTFSGATPTDTPFPTVVIARQYDPFADFPRYPLNPFALANSVMGLFYAHDYSQVTLDPSDPNYNPGTTVRHYLDTTYYMIPAEHLP